MKRQLRKPKFRLLSILMHSKYPFGELFDDAIRQEKLQGKSSEELFFKPYTLEVLIQATIHEATEGIDGWVSLEVSPLLADDTDGAIKAAQMFQGRARCPSNLFIKIPSTCAGIPAIKESIFEGMPVNVTLLFSCEYYMETAEAYMRRIERRIASGLDQKVYSVAAIFVSRWDIAVK